MNLAPPTPAEAMRAYRQVDGWVRAFAVPEVAEPVSKPAAACVILRANGAVLGRGVAVDTTGQAVPRAVRAALSEARERLNLANDALADEHAREFAKNFAICLELSGALIPITPLTFAECDLELSQGLDGVAASVGGKTEALFPGWMLATASFASDGLVSCVAAASGDPNLAIKVNPKSQPPQLAAEHGVTCYRFRATHLAQLAADQEPIFLHRGGRIVSQRDITRGTLIQFAADLNARLAGIREDGRTFQPLNSPYFSWKAQVAPSADPVLDDSLRVLGMAVYARAGVPTPAGKAKPGVMHEAVGALFERELVVRKNSPLKDRPLHAAGYAAVAYAEAVAADVAAKEPRDFDALGIDVALQGAFDLESGWSPRVEGPERAFIAYGLACWSAMPNLSEPERAKFRALAESAVRAVYRDTKPNLLVGQMPWLGWAELIVSKDKPEIPAAAVLREMRDVVWRHQLSVDDGGADGPDLVGGIVFTASANPLPAWQSSRAIAFLASAMGDRRLTDPDERMRETVRMLAGLRFLRQLAVDDAAAYAAMDPLTATWGIRASLWDQRQTPEATALTLIAVCEFLKGLDEATAAANAEKSGVK